MDIFKLIFEHDLRLEQLSGNHDPRQERKRPSTLEEFMKPVQTYSSFYLTGTRFPEQHFGLNALEHYSALMSTFANSMHVEEVFTPGDAYPLDNLAALAKPGQTFTTQKDKADEHNALFSVDLSVREKIPYLKEALDGGQKIIFAEQAHDGTDLFMFSKDNVYEQMFEAFKPLLSDTFRFFSINGKRAKSERLFYFETWTLERPPHGFEEVFKETVLR